MPAKLIQIKCEKEAACLNPLVDSLSRLENKKESWRKRDMIYLHTSRILFRRRDSDSSRVGVSETVDAKHSGRFNDGSTAVW
jgi:hypothetical protein